MKKRTFNLVITGLLLFSNLLFGGCKTIHNDSLQEGFGSDKFKPFFFIHAGDPQVGMVTRLGLGSIEEDKGRFIQLAKRANELNCPFVLVAGDLVHFFYGANPDKKYGTARENIAAFDEALQQFKVPVKLIPGNHEVHNLYQLNKYREKYGKDYYAFTYNNCDFICLNSVTLETESRHVDKQVQKTAEYKREVERQWRWLEDTLKKSRTKGRNHIFILKHFPPFIEKEDEGQTYHAMRPESRKRLLKLVREYDVKVIMVGHVHKTYELTTEDFVIYTVGGTSCVFDDKGFGYRIFKVYDDKVEQEYFRIGQPVEKVKL